MDYKENQNALCKIATSIVDAHKTEEQETFTKEDCEKMVKLALEYDFRPHIDIPSMIAAIVAGKEEGSVDFWKTTAESYKSQNKMLSSKVDELVGELLKQDAEIIALTEQLNIKGLSNNETEKKQYKFDYKDENGAMGSDIVLAIEDEEAIARFEKKHPDLVWRGFTVIPPIENELQIKLRNCQAEIQKQYDNATYLSNQITSLTKQLDESKHELTDALVTIKTEGSQDDIPQIKRIEVFLQTLNNK